MGFSYWSFIQLDIRPASVSRSDLGYCFFVLPQLSQWEITTLSYDQSCQKMSRVHHAGSCPLCFGTVRDVTVKCGPCFFTFINIFVGLLFRSIVSHEREELRHVGTRGSSDTFGIPNVPAGIFSRNFFYFQSRVPGPVLWVTGPVDRLDFFFFWMQSSGLNQRSIRFSLILLSNALCLICFVSLARLWSSTDWPSISFTSSKGRSSSWWRRLQLGRWKWKSHSFWSSKRLMPFILLITGWTGAPVLSCRWRPSSWALYSAFSTAPSAGLLDRNKSSQWSDHRFNQLVFYYGSIRALTEPRWADEIRRMVDSLFHLLQQPKPSGKSPNSSSPSPTGPATTDMSRPFNRLSNYFITCGQWLPLPPESHVIITITSSLMIECREL